MDLSRLVFLTTVDKTIKLSIINVLMGGYMQESYNIYYREQKGNTAKIVAKEVDNHVHAINEVKAAYKTTGAVLALIETTNRSKDAA